MRGQRPRQGDLGTSWDNEEQGVPSTCAWVGDQACSVQELDAKLMLSISGPSREPKLLTPEDAQWSQHLGRMRM